MPRLNQQRWEQARADYEVKGISLREVARRHGVAESAVRKRAKSEGWIQGKSAHLVEKKVNAVKALAEYGLESAQLSRTYQHTIETVARERLQAEGALAEFDLALAQKGQELLQNASTPEDYELIARGRKHLAPQTPKNEVKVNMTQQTAIAPLTPRQALQELAKKAGEDGTG